MSMASIRRRAERLAARVEAEYAKIHLPEPAQRPVEATRDPFTWVTQYAKSWNEHWVEEGRPILTSTFRRTSIFKTFSTSLTSAESIFSRSLGT